MGVDLGDICIKHTLSLETLNNKIIAIDAYNILYQFLASIRQEDGTPLMDLKGNPTAHLSGLFYRTSRLLENGIKPAFVFDGTAHRLKEKTQIERREIKEKAVQKWKEAIELESKEARKYAQGTSRLTSSMVAQSKDLLEAMGVPTIQAPSDGEAQASMMVHQGLAYATGSQDYDALLFGSDRLIRNISITGRRKIPRQDKYIIVEPEEITLKETLDSVNLTREQLIFIGLMLGTDFNEGVKGIGPKKAIKIITQIKTLSELVAYLKEKHAYEFEVDPQEVLDLFMKPAYTEPQKMQWKPPNKERIQDILVSQHDFSQERVERTVDELEKVMKEKGAQSRLEQWF
ncbi:flap endonuclease-1 [Candidatus Micrarchaeota archaeon]|nr:flap endonuclease-1 [Candidatus Micrarchaeota archaeon]